MTVMIRIRKAVFGITQDEMAGIAGVSQAVVSAWENEHSVPTLLAMKRIREAALARGLTWEDSWFFDAPVPTQDAGASA